MLAKGKFFFTSQYPGITITNTSGVDIRYPGTRVPGNNSNTLGMGRFVSAWRRAEALRDLNGCWSCCGVPGTRTRPGKLFRRLCLRSGVPKSIPGGNGRNTYRYS
eukprot:2444700-Rhodomonas_salina.2